MSVMGMWRIRSSSVWMSMVQPVRAWLKEMVAVWYRLTPSRLNDGCSLSFTTNTMSAGNTQEQLDYCNSLLGEMRHRNLPNAQNVYLQATKKQTTVVTFPIKWRMQLVFQCLLIQRYILENVAIMARLLPVFIIIMNICSHINGMHLWSCMHVALSVIFYNAGIVCCCNW